MNNIEKIIRDNLQQLKGKSAKHITNFLKEIGGGDDGSMVDGLINLVNVLADDKHHSIIKVAVISTLTSAILSGGGVILFYNHRDKAQNKKDKQYIINALKKEVATAKNDTIIPINDNELEHKFNNERESDIDSNE